jgi:hypothetical protein
LASTFYSARAPICPEVSDIASRQLVAIGAKADVTLISREVTQVTDAVEKVGPSIGINALGIFDPAETGRRFGFTAA